MLTNISGTNLLTGYPAQPTTSDSDLSKASSESAQPNSSKIESDDTVSISQESKELEQGYKKRKSVLEQNRNEDRQDLERSYLQQKSRLEREFQQKKQAIEINLYA